MNKEIYNPESINIGNVANNPTEEVLSNFAETPFELNGIKYNSIEIFWQSLKVPEDSELRTQILGFSSSKAKRNGKRFNDTGKIYYNSETLDSGSSEHHELMKLALRAKFEQNDEARKLLLGTKGRTITHILKNSDGTIQPDSKTIPREIFCKMLMELRDEFEKKEI